jgi:hypothetical protein
MRAARWAVVFAAVCAVVAVAGVAYAAGKAKAVPVAEVVRARRVEVADGKGRARGVLPVMDNGSVGLVLASKDGEAG